MADEANIFSTDGAGLLLFDCASAVGLWKN
jgi:hypothetical protein